MLAEFLNLCMFLDMKLNKLYRMEDAKEIKIVASLCFNKFLEKKDFSYSFFNNFMLTLK